MNCDLSKIRIKCAEIVGWTYIEQLAFTGIPKGSRGNADARVIPNYPESADAALELVAWMAKPENGECWPDASHNYPDRQWSFAFTHGTEVCHGVADTFHLAVCLAFLRANNIEPETL